MEMNDIDYDMHRISDSVQMLNKQYFTISIYASLIYLNE